MYHRATSVCQVVCVAYQDHSLSRHVVVEGVAMKIPIVSIVDDDEAVRLALGGLVQSLGWQARMYESAEAYLASAEAVDTSCLVIDVQLSGMSGLTMYERLSAQSAVPATIFTSAYSTPLLKAKVESSGGLVLLEKPYHVATMTNWLALALGKRVDE
jgi:FixJ family two-component response regulator